MNNYSIIILGPSGSGKSIFLASFYKALSTSGNFGFFIDVQDPTKRISLNKIYADLTTGENWPLGTRNISEWVFTCYVNTPELSKIPACKLTYVDYAGGIITDLSTSESNYSDYNDLESYFTTSDAVLAILDGQKLLSCMQDKNSTNKGVLRWLNEDLPNLMQMVAKCKKDTSVHFIISKWDLLEDYYSLAEVRNYLLNTVTEFYNIVGMRKKAGCSVHLIPVSSLGKGFARLQSDGQMKKLSGKIPRPINVEVPFAFALKNKLNKNPSSSKQKTFKLTVVDWVVIGLCLVLIPVGGLGLIIVIVYFGVRLWTKNKANSQQTSSKTLSSEDAFEQILSSCIEITKQFDTDFPDSNLTAIS